MFSDEIIEVTICNLIPNNNLPYNGKVIFTQKQGFNIQGNFAFVGLLPDTKYQLCLMQDIMNCNIAQVIKQFYTDKFFDVAFDCFELDDFSFQRKGENKYLYEYNLVLVERSIKPFEEENSQASNKDQILEKRVVMVGNIKSFQLKKNCENPNENLFKIAEKNQLRNKDDTISVGKLIQRFLKQKLLDLCYLEEEVERAYDSCTTKILHNLKNCIDNDQ